MWLPGEYLQTTGSHNSCDYCNLISLIPCDSEVPGVCRNTGQKDISGGIGIPDRAMIVGPGALCVAVFLLRTIY